MNDLKKLQKFYEQALCDKIFQYELISGQTLQVIFYRESFCHLLGIQHITNNRHFIGRSGYDRIQSGGLTAKLLKRINRPGFAKIEHRIEHFTRIEGLMQQGSIFRFYPERAGRTRIQATHLVYEEDKKLYLHLFLKRESAQSDIYAPMSYIVLTERDDNPELYVAGQEYKNIVNLSVLPMEKPLA